MLVSHSSLANLRHHASAGNPSARASVTQTGPVDQVEIGASEAQKSWLDRNPKVEGALFGGAFGGSVGAFFGTILWGCGAPASIIPNAVAATGLFGAAYFALQE